MKTSDYNEDFFGWTQEQAALLLAMPETAGLLDVECLADEIEGLGQAEVNRLSSLLNNVLVRLVKLAVARDALETRQWVDDLLASQSDAAITAPPGLQRHLDLPKIWKVARNVAKRSLKNAGVDVPVLPELCPLSVDELLEPEFDLEAVMMKMTVAIRASESS